MSWASSLFSVDGLLILGDAVATLAMGAGIVMEWPPSPTSRQRIAAVLVMGGVVAETVFSLSLFLHDESVSHRQQDKIIALETRLAPRVLTDEQFSAILTLRGKVTAVSVMASPDAEPALFSAQLQEALYYAGIVVVPIPAPAGDRWVGTQVCMPSKENEKNSPLWKVFSSTGLEPSHCSFGDIETPVREDIPLIIVGERQMFWPNGEPKSLLFRAYPGMAVKLRSETPAPSEAGPIPNP